MCSDFFTWFVPSLVALSLGAGGGKYIIDKIWYPEVIIEDSIRRFRQNHHVWRIIIKNVGRATAHDVQVDVTKVIENGKPRDNFLPMPLQWTHLGKEIRDINSKQTVYLDVFEHHIKNQNVTVNIATSFGGGVDDFRELRTSDNITTLELTIFERNGRNIKTHVDVLWKSGIILDARVRGRKWFLGIYNKKRGIRAK